jgi:hypothetical protein
MTSRRPSYEIIRELIKRVSAKRFSYQTRISLPLAYKWEKDPEHLEELYGADNAQRNPIDRTEDIIRCCVTEGHHDIAVEIMDGLARQLGGAYVSGKEINAIKRVADIDLSRCAVDPNDIAALKRVAEADKDNGQDIARCMFCGFKYIPHGWRLLSGACDACYEKIHMALGNEYELMPRNRP